MDIYERNTWAVKDVLPAELDTDGIYHNGGVPEVYLVLEFDPYNKVEVRKTWILESLEKAKKFIENEIQTYPPYSTNAFGSSKPPRFVIVKGTEFKI